MSADKTGLASAMRKDVSDAEMTMHAANFIVGDRVTRSCIRRLYDLEARHFIDAMECWPLNIESRPAWIDVDKLVELANGDA